MDFLQKIGGRKFWMAILVVGIATFIELKTERGMTEVMAAFLGAIVASFSAANYMATAKHMDTRSGGVRPDDSVSKIDALLEITTKANSPENMQALTDLLRNISSGVTEVKAATGQIGNAVLNIGNEISKARNRN